ncbi:NUDIX hydrolase [Sphingopyxis alaskensis]|jgi:ADP-ribose pyrophosphatase|uniref:GDP-mannose pyrophosphatase n=1 Tax=Sphingopyxis alaskensis (strain DSM 13593 / LMG 18877 / RB2256) TaxID=317655 RepID=Q1GUG7_SPHAL|nr:NUDIX hydrolase [Sphingopyxis alaskensis]ABF52705.1 NUDIX hydrolase [Sphingopyxis alaskensis RB2256]MCM3418241.1 NUDIX hydrolase [Sphingopyxis alaskensis]
MTRPAPDSPIETRWEGRFVTVKQQGNWEYVARSRGIHAAVILAIDEDARGRHAILVEQYRVPLKRQCLELPAGLVGDDSAGEAAEVAAARELEEETGYRAATWRTVGEFYSSPGMVSESFTLLVATGLTKVGAGGGVGGEDIVVHRVPLNGIEDFVAAKRAEGCGIDVRVAMLLAGGLLADT